MAGYLDGGMQALDDGPAEMVGRTERITAGTLADQLGGPDPPLVVDIRSPAEWEAGRIDGAINLPLSRLAQDLDSLPVDQAVVVHCASGYRSAIAASLLQHQGRADVADLVGGLPAWEAQGLI